MDYDYKAGMERVSAVLNSKKNVKEIEKVPKIRNFTYKNGYYSNVTAIFIDIKDSTKLFGEHKRTSTSKIIRAFTSEIIEILINDDNLREIGIRGDCVYGIYTYSSKEENYETAQRAIYINTYLKMLNEMLSEKNMDNIVAGIGVTNGKELIIKAGRKGTDINNLVWIGETVTHASKFSGIANRDVNKPIIFSASFYNSVKSKLKEDSKLYIGFKSVSYHKDEDLKNYYSLDVKIKEFNKWIDGGMK